MDFKWLDIAKRLEAIAQTGLTFSQNEFDRERYEEIRSISHRIFHHHTDAAIERIADFFSTEKGYPTPKVDVRGVVFREEKILMVKERLDQRWAIPGGWADIGLTPAEVVVKEVQEEAGLEVEPQRLLAVLDKKQHDHPPSPLYVYKMFFLCHEKGGHTQTGIETMDVGFFTAEDLPPLSYERNTREQIQLLFDLIRHPGKPVIFD